VTNALDPFFLGIKENKVVFGAMISFTTMVLVVWRFQSVWSSVAPSARL
jgi:hypothetical protein